MTQFLNRELQHMGGTMDKSQENTAEKQTLFQDNKVAGHSNRNLSNPDWYRTIFKRSPIGIGLIDSITGEFCDLNQSFADLVGRSIDELRTMDWMSITHPDDVQPDLDNMALFNAGKIKGFNMEKRYILPDGDIVWTALTVTPLLEPDGSHKRHLAMVQNISAQKKVLDDLRSSEERFRNVVEYTPFPLMIHAEDGEVIFINKVWTDLSGYSANEIPTISKWAEKAYGSGSPKAECAIQDLYGISDIVKEGKWDIRTKSGEVVIWDFSSAPLGRLKDNRRTVLSMAMDITEKHKAEIALIESEDQFRSLADNLKLAIMRYDSKCRHIYQNAEGYALSGFTKEEFLGKTHRELGFDEKLCDLWESKIEAVFETGESANVIFEWQSVSGKQVMEIHFYPELDQQGKCETVLGISYDITNLKRTEQRLLKARAQADAASHAKSVFLANMSHELRTPMNGVMGMAQLLGLTDLNRQQQEYLHNITKCSESLLNLLGDILNVARIDADKAQLIKQPFYMDEVIKDVRKLFALEATGKNLAFTSKINEQVSGHRFVGDPIRIKQVVSILVGNAIKFTHEGSVIIKVTSDFVENSHQLRISVEDTGIGVPKNRLSAIFKDFEQADNSKTRAYGGTGLGLAIVDRLVTLMRGSIDVKSITGKGSTFTITLPLPMAETAFPNDRKGDDINASTKLKIKVLVVDDDPLNLAVIKQFAETLADNVDVANSGEMAVRQSAINNYDLILMDVQMPGINGLKATRMIRELERKTNGKRAVIIAATAHVLDKDRDSCLQSGMDDFISKPIEMKRLSELLTKHFKG